VGIKKNICTEWSETILVCDEPTLYRFISYKIIIYNYLIIYQRLLKLVHRGSKFVETCYIQTRCRECLKTFIIVLVSNINIENRGYKARGKHAWEKDFVLLNV